MNYLVARVPMVGLSVAFLISLLMVMNHTVLFGGRQGLLRNALKPIVEGERLELSGQLTLSPKDSDGHEDIMAMTIDIEGTIHPSAHTSKIILNLNQPLTNEAIPLAQIVYQKDELWLIQEGESGSPIDLSAFIPKDPLNAEALEGLWTSFFDQMTVSETNDYDMRPNKGHLKANFVNYHVNLMDLLDEDQNKTLHNQLGMFGSQDMFIDVTVVVDNTGRLAWISVQSDVGMFGMMGWVALKN